MGLKFMEGDKDKVKERNSMDMPEMNETKRESLNTDSILKFIEGDKDKVKERNSMDMPEMNETIEMKKGNEKANQEIEDSERKREKEKGNGGIEDTKIMKEKDDQDMLNEKVKCADNNIRDE